MVLVYGKAFCLRIKILKFISFSYFLYFGNRHFCYKQNSRELEKVCFSSLALKILRTG